MSKLNIGCGGTSRYPFRDLACEVNCDLEKPKLRVSNFVVCDAHYLPFIQKVFSETFAYHIIEHLGSPSTFLGECARVTLDQVHIVTPNIYSGDSFRDEGHCQHFTYFTLNELLKSFFNGVRIIGEEGFWLQIRGNKRVFHCLKPLSSKLAFLANHLHAICWE